MQLLINIFEYSMKDDTDQSFVGDLGQIVVDLGIKKQDIIAVGEWMDRCMHAPTDGWVGG